MTPKRAAEIANRHVPPQKQSDLKNDILAYGEAMALAAVAAERDACATQVMTDARLERETAARLERSPHEQDLRQAEKHILAAVALEEAAEAIRNRT